MKRIATIFLIILVVITTSCGSKKVATKTSNTTSKTVDQVLKEKTSDTQNTDDKNHGGTVTNPNDQNSKSVNNTAPAISGGSSQITASSNLKRSNSGAVINASDIDIDLTRLSSTMVYSEVYNMMNSPESYVGKVIRMDGKLAVYKYPERNYYTCIIQDATACCQQGMEFLWAGNHKYPEDYPNEGDNIIVTGVFDIYYEGENKYVQLKNASLVRARV